MSSVWVDRYLLFLLTSLYQTHYSNSIVWTQLTSSCGIIGATLWHSLFPYFFCESDGRRTWNRWVWQLTDEVSISAASNMCLWFEHLRHKKHWDCVTITYLRRLHLSAPQDWDMHKSFASGSAQFHPVARAMFLQQCKSGSCKTWCTSLSKASSNLMPHQNGKLKPIHIWSTLLAMTTQSSSQHIKMLCK